MIKKGVLSILIIIVSLQFGFSQQRFPGTKPILFRGVVIDAVSQERLPGSDIIVNKNISAISAEDGTFSFYAFKKDTIKFNMLGYKAMTLIVNDSLSSSEFLTGVYLETDTTHLGEVIIVPRIANLRAELINPKLKNDPQLENAVSNITTASYVGRTTPAKLGDPVANYTYLKQKNKMDAFERGGIPSERILGLSPFILVPAAFLLIEGVPQIPPPPKAQISAKDMDDLRKKYLESARKGN
jgi:hypothetical protein